MEIRNYFPSGQFVVILVSLVVSVGIIGSTERYVHPPLQSSILQASPSDIPSNDWQKEFASNEAYTTSKIIADSAQQLVDSVKTSNLTESIGRSILISTTAAAGQGIMESTETQDQIISDALAQVQAASITSNTYSSADITVVPNSINSYHAWGNEFVEALTANPDANYESVMLGVSLAVDTQSSSPLKNLSSASEEYEKLAAQIIKIPTPNTLSPLVVELANAYSQLGISTKNLAEVFDDPAQSLVEVQKFTVLSKQNAQTLLQIAEILKSNGILFSKNEPGNAWSAITVSTSSQ